MNLKRQYFAALVSAAFTMCFGACHAFSSILLFQLQKPDSPIPITDEEASWIASIFLLPGPLGSLTVGILMEIYGRSKLVQLAYLLMLLGWAIISQADTTLMICAGRFINGFAGGMEAAGIVYVTEIMIAPTHRSTLLSLLPPIFNVGMAMSYVIGYYFPWRHQAIFMSLLTAIGFALMFVVPETPSWLMSKNKIKETNRSLRWLLNNSAHVDEELAKLQMADASKAADPSHTKRESLLRSIVTTGAWKPMLIIATFIILGQLCGYSILVFYTVNFYESFGTPIDGRLSSVIFAVVIVISTLVLVAVINLVNRKTLMMASATGVCVFSSISAAHVYCFRNVPNKPVFWLPVAGVWLIIIFASIGLNTLPWTMAGELFPTKVRGTMVGLVWSLTFSVMFASVKMYPFLVSVVHIHGVLAMFAGAAVVAFVCSIFMLPETRGKTLQEIEKMWLPKSK